ncbi:MAG: CHAP domain-containing protein [Thermomicrobiales bacterium]|nr:CHAP domain-containing protein [Thermomicrobiales bacterium]
MALFRSTLIAFGLLLAIVSPPILAQSSNPYVSWYQGYDGVWHSNCTFWAWQRWYEVNGEALPSWGNAGEWAANAAAAGFPVDTVPAAGAIVMTWESPIGHVAFVEAVSPDDPNTFLISEYGFAAGVEYHERWMTTDGSLLFISPKTVASSVTGPIDGTAP